MSMMRVFNSDAYEDGRTKQSFKDSTDINKILLKAARGDTISHLAKHGAVYGDFTDMPDLLEASGRLAKGQAIFDDLPGEVKREFNQDAVGFFQYVNDPRNAENLPNVLPALAAPGNQLRPIVRSKETMANVEVPDPAPVADPPEPPPGQPAG